MSELKSKCCGAEVEVLFTTIDWYVDKTVTENNYKCLKCHKSTEVEEIEGIK